MTDSDAKVLKAIIVDDEELARQGLEMRLSAIENVQMSRVVPMRRRRCMLLLS